MKKSILFLAVPCVLISLLTSCRDPATSEFVTLRNQSSGQYHMFLSFEDFDISNRLEPGEFRNVLVSERQTIGGEITAIVGRNQIQEATVTCDLLFDSPGEDAEFVGATVTWDGTTAVCVEDAPDGLGS